LPRINTKAIFVKVKESRNVANKQSQKMSRSVICAATGAALSP